MTKLTELKGIVETVLKDGKTYKIEYTFNSIILLEEKFGSVEDAFKSLSNKVNLKDIRFLVYAGLHQHHKLSEDEAGNLIELSKVNETFEAIQKAFEFAFPQDEDGK